MKIEHRDGKIQRKVLIAMITSKVVLGRVAPKWSKDGLFKDKWSNIIGGWCVKYFLKYGKAPNKSIEGIFDSWSAKADKETATIIERFLEALSGEYDSLRKDLNPKYIIDLAESHFNEVAATKLAEEVQGDISRGKTDEAFHKINSFVRIEMGEGETVDVLSDQEALRLAFEDKSESIIKFPGCLGHFFGGSLARDSFIAFTGPDKSGKSYWLTRIAWQGMLQRLKVAHFVIGDMSKSQVLRERYAPLAVGRPLKATPENETVKYPISISFSSDDKYATTETKERIFKRDLEWGKAWAAFQDVVSNKVKSNKPLLKLSCHPAAMISALGIKSIIQGWERIDWMPDVVVIDYADNLAAIDGKEETRHAINRTWQELSSLRTELHCLLVTATQANAAAYTAYLLGPQHFSENKMKNAHVSGMIGINQSEDEKLMDVTRLNWIRRRSEFSTSGKFVNVAGCRDIGNIAIKSCY